MSNDRDNFAHLLPDFMVAGPSWAELAHLVRQIVGKGYGATEARDGAGFAIAYAGALDDAAFVTLLDFLMDAEVPS